MELPFVRVNMPQHLEFFKKASHSMSSVRVRMLHTCISVCIYVCVCFKVSDSLFRLSSRLLHTDKTQQRGGSATAVYFSAKGNIPSWRELSE